jgi:hypothetical protein
MSKLKVIIIFITLYGYAQGADLGFLAKQTSEYTKVCEGAYVSENHFITAAHCIALLNALYFDNEIIPVVNEDNEFYPLVDCRVSSKFRTRLEENIHDDLAIAITEPRENRVFLNVSKTNYFSPEIIVSLPKQKNESGQVMLDKEGNVYGVLSRKYRHGGSVYTFVNEEILMDLF